MVSAYAEPDTKTDKIYYNYGAIPMDNIISAEIKNIPLIFQTDAALFSPGAVDAGTLAMLSIIDFQENDKVLDLGCGYGVAGILAGKLINPRNVIMCDISGTAVKYAKINASLNQVPAIEIRLSDGYGSIPCDDFTLILSNPPYHTDFSVAKHFIEKGFHKLAVGGRMVMVTKRLTWYKNKFTSVFGGVKVHEIDGYYVFAAEKRNSRIPKKTKKTNHLSKKLQRKYEKRGGVSPKVSEYDE